MLTGFVNSRNFSMCWEQGEIAHKAAVVSNRHVTSTLRTVAAEYRGHAREIMGIDPSRIRGEGTIGRW
jgi:hypothetical protein